MLESDILDGVCARAMKGYGERIREKMDKKIIRQEQSDKQATKADGIANSLEFVWGVVKGEKLP